MRLKCRIAGLCTAPHSALRIGDSSVRPMLWRCVSSVMRRQLGLVECEALVVSLL